MELGIVHLDGIKTRRRVLTSEEHSLGRRAQGAHDGTHGAHAVRHGHLPV